MRQIMARTGIACSMVWIALAVLPARAGEDMALVSEKGFDCFIRHLGSYLEQGQEIVVDFEDCPSQPGLMQRMEAREATNLLPGAGDHRDDAAPGYRKYMIFSPDTAICLRRNAARVRAAATDSLVALVPADCRP